MLNINLETLKGKSNKEIAAELRKELKVQFKGVKFSVTSSIYSINCKCSEEEFEIHRNEIKEVVGMFAKYSRDTIYINSGIAYYSDTKEYKEQQQKEREERENLYNSNVTIDSINPNNIKVVNVEDKEIFVTALEPALNKNNWKIDNDQEIEEKSYLNKYKITDLVIMNEENYNYFSFNLLNDYDFLTDKGGSCVDDITEVTLYSYAVCIYCEGKEPLIIDPQGYSYARYTNKLINDINGSLQQIIDSELIIKNELYLETINNIDVTGLYIYNTSTWSYLENKIINDERFIYNDYVGNVVITGLAYKEMLLEGDAIELIKEKYNCPYDILMESILKCENGEVKQLFTKSKLETIFSGIKFSERLIKEIERATEHKPEPDPEKPRTKKDNNSITETKQDKSNIITVDFTRPRATINAEWKEEQATSKQLYALYCITKIKTTGLQISKGATSELISKSKKGIDIKEELQTLITNQIAIAK